MAPLYWDIDCIIAEQPSYRMHMLDDFDKYGSINVLVLWDRKDTYIR